MLFIQWPCAPEGSTGAILHLWCFTFQRTLASLISKNAMCFNRLIRLHQVFSMWLCSKGKWDLAPSRWILTRGLKYYHLRDSVYWGVPKSSSKTAGFAYLCPRGNRGLFSACVLLTPRCDHALFVGLPCAPGYLAASCASPNWTVNSALLFRTITSRHYHPSQRREPTSV